MWRLPGCCPAVWLSVSVLGDNVWVSCYLRCSSCARPWPGPGLVPGNTGQDTAPCEDLSLGSLGCGERHHVAQVP